MSRFISTKRDPLQSGNKSFDVRDLIAWAINSDDSFNTHGVGIRASQKIDAALEKCAGRDYIEISSEESWKLLCDALENPSFNGRRNPYPVLPARRLIPFIDDVKDAPEERPEPEPEQVEQPVHASA